jgi:hypothetical protein
MNSIFSNCLDFLKTDEAKTNMKQYIITPMGDILYKEMYFYVWLICFYHLFLILLVLITVLMLFKQYYLTQLYLSNVQQLLVN